MKQLFLLGTIAVMTSTGAFADNVVLNHLRCVPQAELAIVDLVWFAKSKDLAVDQISELDLFEYQRENGIDYSRLSVDKNARVIEGNGVYARIRAQQNGDNFEFYVWNFNSKNPPAGHLTVKRANENAYGYDVDCRFVP